jgi:recombination protein RecT
MSQPKGPSSTAVAKANAAVDARPKVTPIQEMIQKSVEQLRMALPSHMNAERLVRIALTTIRLNPKLSECTPESFMGALFQSAQLGLEPNLGGEAWLIPYKNKRKVGNEWITKLECQFQIGAYGLVKLYWNHQNSVSLQVENVHEQDDFSFDIGISEVHHKLPAFNKERGAVVGYYAYATMQNGGRHLKVMSKQEALEFARKFSKCWDREKQEFMPMTPWRDHFDAMAQKTVLKMLMKLLPKSVELQRALAMDETVKTKVEADMFGVPNEIEYASAEVVDEAEKLLLAASAQGAVAKTNEEILKAEADKRFQAYVEQIARAKKPEVIDNIETAISVALREGMLLSSHETELGKLLNSARKRFEQKAK